MVVMSIAAGGCSRNYWPALFEMFIAESAHQKGAALATQKGADPKERLKHYRTACEHFKKAYDRNPGIFTLNRILSAAESCAWIEDHAGEGLFSEFSDRYVREHPDEAEYGDAGVDVMEF